MRLKNKIRSKVFGTKSVPRLSVFRSSKHIYVQLIDDEAGKTLLSASDAALKTGTKTEKAIKVGGAIAAEASKKDINKVVFDRNGFKYAGRIKILADEARKGGLKF